MKSEVITTKKYHVVLDEFEMMELCEEISSLDKRSIDISTLHNLHTILEALV